MKNMTTRLHVLIFQFLLALLILSPQAPLNAGAEDTNPSANPAPADQAPDEATKKITDLVHAGKYGEAQQLTEALLIAYPNDQRLIKAKALIDKLIAPTGTIEAAPDTSQPIQPAANASAERLTGMDKVDYNALIVLAEEAQQTTDLDEQRKLLKQFMDQSSTFLPKHPDQELLWQLRAASAISLNEPLEGYEAGQRLLAAGAAESSDPPLQKLLGQLKNKGWFEEQEAEKQAETKMEYLSILGTWNGHLSRADHKGHEIAHFDWTIEFLKVNSEIDGYITTRNGKRDEKPTFKGTILDSGEVSWERRWDSDWTPVQVETSNDRRTMKIAFTATINIDFNAFNTNGTPELCTQSITLTKFAAPVQQRSTSFDNSSTQPTAQRAATTRFSSPLQPAGQAVSSTTDPRSSQQASSAGPTTAILHLYRLSHVVGAFSQYEIEIDGRQVAKIGNAESVRMDLSPGKHNINVTFRRVKSDRPLYDLEMEPGKEYWIRIDLSDSFIVHMRLAVVPEAEARQESEKLKEIADGDLPNK